MSDASQGPGWWQASDGKWYPPQPPPPDATVAEPGVAGVRREVVPTAVTGMDEADLRNTLDGLIESQRALLACVRNILGGLQQRGAKPPWALEKLQEAEQAMARHGLG